MKRCMNKGPLAGVLGLTLLCAGCGGSGSETITPTTQRSASSGTETGTASSNGQPEGGEVELGPSVEFVGLVAKVPASWQSEMPSSNMRVAQFRLPGVDGADDAELAIFDFGPGMGGSVLDNIRRWTGQVTGPDGNAVPPTVVEATIGDMTITKVESTGTFMSGMPGDSSVRENTTVINAQLIKSPDQFIFFKLIGPRATVEANRAGFEAMLGSITRGE